MTSQVDISIDIALCGSKADRVGLHAHDHAGFPNLLRKCDSCQPNVHTKVKNDIPWMQICKIDILLSSNKGLDEARTINRKSIEPVNNVESRPTEIYNIIALIPLKKFHRLDRTEVIIKASYKIRRIYRYTARYDDRTTCAIVKNPYCRALPPDAKITPVFDTCRKNQYFWEMT